MLKTKIRAIFGIILSTFWKLLGGGGLKNKYISGIIGGQIKIFSERLL